MEVSLNALLNERWVATWEDNYNNKTEAARDINRLMQTNYKGHKYVPWAIMQRWFYKLDPHAELEVILNDNGGIVHTDVAKIEEYKSDKTGETILRRSANSHFVKLKATFIGKTMIETYPIQDNSYNAPNYIDSNMVNKSLQRAKARLISMITGLGYQLYEIGDLQFEDDVDTNENKKTVVKKVMAPAPAPTENVEVADNTTKVVEAPAKAKSGNDIDDFIDYLFDNKETILPIVQELNKDIVKQYNKVIDLNDRAKTLDALSHVKNIKIFSNAVKKRHEDLLKKGDK